MTPAAMTPAVVDPSSTWPTSCRTSPSACACATSRPCSPPGGRAEERAPARLPLMRGLEKPPAGEGGEHARSGPRPPPRSPAPGSVT
jgi:hypothetical protein